MARQYAHKMPEGDVEHALANALGLVDPVEPQTTEEAATVVVMVVVTEERELAYICLF